MKMLLHEASAVGPTAAVLAVNNCTKQLGRPGDFVEHNLKRTTESSLSEVLEFLSKRPVHTVVLAGLLKSAIETEDNGVGEFLEFRTSNNTLEGVALFGRITTFETRSDVAVIAFADYARRRPPFRLVVAEDEPLQKFWEFYKEPDQEPEQLCHEWLYEYRRPSQPVGSLPAMRLATMDDLDQIVSAHAELVRDETCVCPLTADAEGFRARCAARINKERVWVLVQDNTLVFKADIAAQTGSEFYLEGVWVNPSFRRQGFGRRCMEQLRRILCGEHGALCGFVNGRNEFGRSFYDSVGCNLMSSYQKVYL